MLRNQSCLGSTDIQMIDPSYENNPNRAGSRKATSLPGEFSHYTLHGARRESMTVCLGDAEDMDEPVADNDPARV
jgi:hypothetical protein